MTLGQRTRMLLVGDIVGTGHPDGLRFYLARVAPELREGDIVYGNLEFPITDRGRYDSSKTWVPGRHMKLADAGALADAGLHVVSVANNHMMDYGGEGLLRTLELLDEQGILHCGGGPNLSSARWPAIVERNGLRVAFLAYTSVCLPHYGAGEDHPGMVMVHVTTAFVPHPRLTEQPGIPPHVLTIPDPEDLEAVRADIRAAKANADLVVVAWHWGVSQGVRKRVPYQREAGRACIDAGASLVVGHHPHVLQGLEVYRGGAIFYSLGNCVFWNSGPPNPKNHDRQGFIVDCEIDRTGLLGVSLRPMLINPEGQPEPIEDGRESHILDAVEKDSEEFGSPFSYEGGRLVLRLRD